MKHSVSFLLFCVVFMTYSQHQVIPLYAENVPCGLSEKGETVYDLNRKMIRHVETPEIWHFPSTTETEDIPAVLVIPGGGYGGLSYEREGIHVAEWLNPLGISVFVLIHRLPSSKFGNCQQQVPLLDATVAIRKIRANASTWNLDPSKIGVMGFSAGGHLASSLSTHFAEPLSEVIDEVEKISARPDFSILIYPVITMKLPHTHMGSRNNLLGKNPSAEQIIHYSNEMQVSENTPPTLLVHAADDLAVVQQNSIHYYLALQKNKVPSALHIWENGGHGFGMRGGKGAISSWPKITQEWLVQRKVIAE